MRRTASVKARDFTDVIYIEREEFLLLCDDGLKVRYFKVLIFKYWFNMVKNNIIEGNYKNLNLKCFICR